MNTTPNHSETEKRESLNTANGNRTETVIWLEKAMRFISHKLRQSVANILGLTFLLNKVKKTPEQISKFMQHSALALDLDTQELSTMVHKKLVELKKQTPLKN